MMQKNENLQVGLYSCRKKNDKWVVAMDKWQKMTDMEVNKGRTCKKKKKKTK